MTEPVSLDDIKQHLVLDPSDESEDVYLLGLLTAARRSCEKRINRAVGDLADDDQQMVAQAVRLIVGHWYANREAVVNDARTTAAELPIAVTWLLGPLRVSPLWEC